MPDISLASWFICSPLRGPSILGSPTSPRESESTGFRAESELRWLSVYRKLSSVFRGPDLEDLNHTGYPHSKFAKFPVRENTVSEELATGPTRYLFSAGVGHTSKTAVPWRELSVNRVPSLRSQSARLIFDCIGS